MKHPFKKVIVTWLDAVNYGDGQGTPKHKPAEQCMIGWLLKRDKQGISVAMEYSPEDNTWREENFIPAGMVKSVRILR